MAYKSLTTRGKDKYLYGYDVVMDDVLSILYTKKGEYPMNPNRGCIIHDFLFEPEITEEEIFTIQSDIEDQLKADSRLQNIRVYVQSASQGKEIVVAIEADILLIDETLLINRKFNLEG